MTLSISESRARRGLQRTLAAALFLIPLLLNPWGYYATGPVKEGAMWLFAGIAGWWLAALWSAKPGIVAVPRRLAWPAALWLAVLAASVATAAMRFPSFWTAFAVVPAVVLAVSGAACARRTSGRQAMVKGWVGGAAVVSVYAIVHHFGIDFVHWAVEGRLWRSPGTLGQPIYLAAYLGMVLPFGVALCGARRAPRWIVPAVTVILCAIVSTYSRAPGVAAAIGIIVTLYAGRGVWTSTAKVRMAKAAVGGIVFAALIITMDLHSPEFSLSRRLTSFSDRSGDSLSTRQHHWRAATQLIQRRPWLGWGPDGYRLNAARFDSDAVGRDVALAYPHPTPHSEWYTAAVESGLIGLLAWGLFVLTLASAASDAGRAERHRDNASARNGGLGTLTSVEAQRALALAGAFGALAAFVVAGSVTPRVTVTTLGLVFCWAITAGTMSTGNTRRRALAGVSVRRALRWSTTLAAVAAVVLGVRIVGADVFSRDGNNALRRGDTEAALTHYETAAAWNPYEPGYRRLWGETALSDAATATGAERQRYAATAVKAFRENEAVEPRNGFWHAGLSQALVYSDTSAATIEAISATKLYPQSSSVWESLAVVCHQQGLEDEEKDALRIAIERSPSDATPFLTLAAVFQQEKRPDLADHLLTWAADEYPHTNELAPWRRHAASVK